MHRVPGLSESVIAEGSSRLCQWQCLPGLETDVKRHAYRTSLCFRQSRRLNIDYGTIGALGDGRLMIFGVLGQSMSLSQIEPVSNFTEPFLHSFEDLGVDLITFSFFKHNRNRCLFFA
jgi:hypothetical protein